MGEFDTAIAVKKDVGWLNVAVGDECDPEINESMHQLPRDTTEHVVWNRRLFRIVLWK